MIFLTRHRLAWMIIGLGATAIVVSFVFSIPHMWLGGVLTIIIGCNGLSGGP